MSSANWGHNTSYTKGETTISRYRGATHRQRKSSTFLLIILRPWGFVLPQLSWNYWPFVLQTSVQYCFNYTISFSSLHWSPVQVSDITTTFLSQRALTLLHAKLSEHSTKCTLNHSIKWSKSVAIFKKKTRDISFSLRRFNRRYMSIT